MKQFAIRLAAIAMLCMFRPAPAVAQSAEVQQLILNYQKLAQLKKILRNMYSGYEILSKGYATVKGLSEGNFKVHDVFLNSLLQVSPAVRNYKRIADIIEDQAALVSAYKAALQRFRDDPCFNEEELNYFKRVYERLFEGSIQNIEALTLVITAGKLRMSDDERIREIDRIYLDGSDKLSFLRHFNNDIAVLSLQRARESQDVDAMQYLYHIKSGQNE
jgi:hypothetical protein